MLGFSPGPLVSLVMWNIQDQCHYIIVAPTRASKKYFYFIDYGWLYSISTHGGSYWDRGSLNWFFIASFYQRIVRVLPGFITTPDRSSSLFAISVDSRTDPILGNTAIDIPRRDSNKVRNRYDTYKVSHRDWAKLLLNMNYLRRVLYILSGLTRNGACLIATAHSHRHYHERPLVRSIRQSWLVLPYSQGFTPIIELPTISGDLFSSNPKPSPT